MLVLIKNVFFFGFFQVSFCLEYVVVNCFEFKGYVMVVFYFFVLCCVMWWCQNGFEN